MKNNALGTKILLALVTLGILAYFAIQGVLYFDDPLSTTLAYTYQVEESTDVSGFVAREEQVLTDDTNGLLRLQRTEGERVSKGGVVATVYADQASLDRQTEIESLTTRIEQLQYAQDAAEGAEISLKLDSQIMQKIISFRSALAEDRLDLSATPGQELRSLVLKRDYTSSSPEELAAEITELQAELNTLRSQSASSTRRITAPVSGFYSAVVDGYETALTTETLVEMTPSALNAVRADESVSSEVGKLILGDSWYYAVAMSTEEAESLRESGSLTLRFAKTVERDLDVTIYGVGPEENGRVVVVFQGKTYLPQLTLLRQQSGQVIREITDGIRIPTAALRAEKVSVDKEGTRTVTEGTGVYCVVGMEARFKPVKVLYYGDGFVLVRASSDAEKTRLRSGDEVIVTAKDLYDGKVVG